MLLSQDDEDPSQATNHQVQVYSPPYLYKGTTRPVIKSAPTVTSRGQTIAVSASANNIVSATPVHLAERRMATTSTSVSSSRRRQRAQQVRAVIPQSASLVPPGYYMLFLVDAKGVPSKASFIRIT